MNAKLQAHSMESILWQQCKFSPPVSPSFEWRRILFPTFLDYVGVRYIKMTMDTLDFLNMIIIISPGHSS